MIKFSECALEVVGAYIEEHLDTLGEDVLKEVYCINKEATPHAYSSAQAILEGFRDETTDARRLSEVAQSLQKLVWARRNNLKIKISIFKDETNPLLVHVYCLFAIENVANVRALLNGKNMSYVAMHSFIA